ncbi:MAG: GAF domain-containing protein [Actinobacteria bacterium]|nr:GAF domain-containing protein [Actinomycetota bacterium]
MDRLSRDDLAAFIAAARSVNQAGDLAGTLDAILDEALRLLEADEGSIMLLSRDRQSLRIRASRGLSPEVVRDTRIPVGEGISGYVAASGQALVIDRRTPVERYPDRGSRQEDLRSAVSVPLRTRGNVEGVLNLNLLEGGGRADDFDDLDLDLAVLFAEYAAAAVHNAQLYQQARRRGDEMARLFEASHVLSGAIDVPDVSERILDAAADLVGARGGFVCVLPEERVAGPEVSAYRDVPRGRVLAVLRRDGFADLLRGSSLRTVGDVAADPVLGPLVGQGESVGAVVAPLVSGDTVRGLLVAITDPGGPPDSAVRSLTTYTNHAALALGKSLLFRSVRTKEDELTSLASSVPDPIVIADETGRFLAINPAAGEQFGLSPKFDIGAPIAGKLRSAELEALLLSPEGGRADVTLFSPHPRTFRARATPVRPGHGLIGARILTLEDVTAEKEMEQLKADFVAVIGHELRTPLTMIKGYAGTLAKRGETMPAESRSKALLAVHDQARRLERLVEDLLLVSRVERSRPPLHLEPLDLVEVIERTIEHAVRQHDGRDIRLQAPPRELRFPIDAVKVEQVMHHLIENAVKFSEAPEPVIVELEASPEHVEVRITDRGSGIFSGDVPHLFERFHQVDGSATRAHGGTGIGLYICRTLVEAHGGAIGVRSALGRGSTFWFSLPTTPPEVPSKGAGALAEDVAPDAQA